MSARTSNRLLALGALWGDLLAAVLVLCMTPRPYRLISFLIVALICAIASECAGALAAGRRVARSAEDPHPGILAGVRVGAAQGLVGGGFAALLFWLLMALATSGFTLQNPVDVSVLLRLQTILGGFFVALTVFLYTLAGRPLLGPVFDLLVRRAVRAGGASGKEDLFVR